MPRVLIQKIIKKDNRDVIIEIKYISMNIRKSIDEICHYAEISMPFAEKDKIRKHDKIFIKYEFEYKNKKEEKLVTTVLIDEITLSVSGSEKNVSVVCRSPARDIVDSSYSDAISNETLVGVVSRIVEKFKDSEGKSFIAVSHYPTNADVSPVIESFNFENESPWSKLINIVENNNYSIASNNAGGLYVWKKDRLLANTAFHKLVEGKNIKSITYTKNGGAQYGKYIAKGNSNEAEATDSSCPASRVMTINISDSNVSETELKNRAVSEMKRRKGETLKIVVPGIGLTESDINKLSTVERTELFFEAKQGIDIDIKSIDVPKHMVCRDVEYTVSKDDFSTTITLVQKDDIT